MLVSEERLQSFLKSSPSRTKERAADFLAGLTGLVESPGECI